MNSGMAALAGKISLAFCLLGALEIDLVLLLDLQGIAAVREMVLLRGAAAYEIPF
jgi:hypothetical protein